MSLPAPSWKLVGNQSFVAATVAGVLDALYTLGQATTYADGTTRTPGAGSAGTFSRYQNLGVTEAVYITPATTTALNQRIILAGYTGAGPAPAPTMASPDVAAADVLLISINKNSGAFSSWNAASPFTTGQFFGYWRVWPTSVGVGSVDLYESQEAVWIVIRNSGGSSTYHCGAGALIDPESPDTTVDAESDGRLYGVWTTGSGGAAATSSFAAPLAGSVRAPFFHSASASDTHAGVFTPGGSAILIMKTRTGFVSNTSTFFRTRSNRFGYSASVMIARSSTSPNDQMLGRARGVAYTSDAMLGQRLLDGSTVVGWIVSGSATTPDQSYLLLS